MTVHPPNLGKYYEEFEVGDIYKHWPGRTLSEADNTWFTLLTMNKHPIHFDHNYAADQMFGKPLINSTLSLAIVAGMSVFDTSQNAVANLGWEEIKLPKPVFIGDTLYAESEIIDKRESRSRRDTGIVTIETRGYNQRNELVVSYRRSMLSKKRGYDDGKIPQFGSE